MLTKEFEYHLPEELIAQTPIEPRDASRLLVIDRKKRSISERKFTDIADYFKPRDILVLNNTKVIAARLLAKRSGGGKAEIFLLKDLGNAHWETLVRPASRLPVGTSLCIGEKITVKIADVTADGGRIIQFNSTEDVKTALYELGQVPLPPYIKKPICNPLRYQTIYASIDGSLAAPTAALHFTHNLLESLKEKGVIIVYTTLHIGLGSFRPIKVESLEEHRMPYEYVHISEDVADIINSAKRDGKKVIACGTDVVRTLESVECNNGLIKPFCGATNLFITPSYQFKVVDMFITNLHIPRSSHLVLVSAFAGIDLMRKAYAYAVKKKFRFYTFGDATLML